MKARILGKNGVVSLTELAGSNGHRDEYLEVAKHFDTLPDDLRKEIGDAAEFMARYQLEEG